MEPIIDSEQKTKKERSADGLNGELAKMLTDVNNGDLVLDNKEKEDELQIKRNAAYLYLRKEMEHASGFRGDHVTDGMIEKFIEKLEGLFYVDKSGHIAPKNGSPKGQEDFEMATAEFVERAIRKIKAEKAQKTRTERFVEKYPLGTRYYDKDNNVLIIENYIPALKSDKDRIEISFGENGFPVETKEVSRKEFFEVVKKYENKSASADIKTSVNTGMGPENKIKDEKIVLDEKSKVKTEKEKFEDEFGGYDKLSGWREDEEGSVFFYAGYANEKVIIRIRYAGDEDFLRTRITVEKFRELMTGGKPFKEILGSRGKKAEKTEEANPKIVPENPGQKKKPEFRDLGNIPIAEEPIKEEDITVPIESVEPVESVKLAEPKESEENPESEKLKVLELIVKNARKDYAESDYKITNTFAKLKNFFGKTFNSDPAAVSDTIYYYENYRKALNELREFRVQLIKEKYSDADNLSETGKMEDFKKEVGDLIVYFNQKEKTNLYDARTDARAGAREGRLGETIVKKSSEMINWYRKLDWKKKLAFSGALLAGGIGATMAATAGIAGGAGIAVFIAGAKIGQRIAGGAAAGVGATAGLEALARRKEEKKSEKNKKELLADLENDWETKFNAISAYCEKEINDYGKSLQKEKQKARERRLFGVFVATFLGSGVAADLAKAGFGMAKEHMPDLLNKIGITTVPENVSNLKDLKAAHSAGPIPEGGAKVSPIAPVSEIPKISNDIIDIDIKKGDSIEGNIIEKLRAMKVGKNEAGKLAHRMALQYAEDNKIPFGKLGHIQPGDHLEFKIDPKHLEDSKIINFERTSGISAPDISHIRGVHQTAEIHNGQAGDLHENAAADIKNVKANIAPVEDSGLGASAGAENNLAGIESAPPVIDHNADMVMIDGISGTAGELKNVSEIGFNIPKDYEAIKEINMLKFLEEMGKVERINAGGGSVVYPNLPHTGFFNQSYVEQGRLASVFKNAITKGILSAKENISVSEALRKIKPEDIESLLKMKK